MRFRLVGASGGCLAALILTAASVAPPRSTEGLHLEWLDRSVEPSRDFFEFANGGWRKANPIPGAYSRWGVFNLLQQQNEEAIRVILEECADDEAALAGSSERKIGDFYASGMDEKAIEAEGLAPLRPELDRISRIRNREELQTEIARLQMIGVDAVFQFGQMQDFADSTQVIGAAFQGGLGLPDRDYYLKQDDKFARIREAYIGHVARMLELVGEEKEPAASAAKNVMALETRLAEASMSRIDERDPEKIYHPMKLSELDELTAGFTWETYFDDVGHPELTHINLGMPDFFKAADRDLQGLPIEEWKAYLRWRLIDEAAPYLSKAFVDEDFQMRSVLTGAQELFPRWQRVIRAANRALGFAIGQKFVEKKFSSQSRARVMAILQDIKAALNDDLETLTWMSPPTRRRAIEKLSLIEEKIGYPDRWRDYSALEIDRGPYVLNVLRANAFDVKRELDKIGKPVDRSEWYMTPQTVDAYYDASMNEIVFPAGILQPPFFDPEAPEAVNYGAVGFVMGHEVTHGFDDEGARFDGRGNLENWWTPEDLEKFKAATRCISDQFSGYTVDGDLHLQGPLVTGEATADLGGLTLAWRAFHASDAYRQGETLEGFTPDQQFFLGAAHVWASNIRPEESRRLVTLDPHPPARYRINGTLSNMPQFQNAFAVPDGSPMARNDRCVIW